METEQEVRSHEKHRGGSQRVGGLVEPPSWTLRHSVG